MALTKFKTSDLVPCKDATLMWVFIDPPGKPDLNGKPRFVASLYVKTESEECKALKELIEDFWDDNKPKGAKIAKSLGFKPVMSKDEAGNEVETEFTSFNFWTGTTFKDGSTRTIDIYNAKGNKVSLGSKKIGNGSKGAISGAMDIYDNGPSARGVTLYLSAIQITKFVEFTSDAGFSAQEEDEDAFEGVDTFEGTTSAPAETTGKPRL